MYITCIQLQKLVRPLRTLQYITVSPQSVEYSNLHIYYCGNNSEPMTLRIIVLHIADFTVWKIIYRSFVFHEIRQDGYGYEKKW